MSEFLTIRGAVSAVEYEAVLKPAGWPVTAGIRSEWRVTAIGLPPFAIEVTQSLVSVGPARTVIELELERRLLP